MTNIWEGGCLKRGTWTICRFRGWGLDRKKRLVFLMVGWCSKAHCIPLLLKNWPSPLPILTTETAYQTFMKLWKYCNIPVKFANKQYNRQMILHETCSTNDIIIYCKSVNLFYKLNFLIFFSFKSFPFPLFTTPPFLAFLHTLNCLYPCPYSPFWRSPSPSLYRGGMKMLHNLQNKSRNIQNRQFQLNWQYLLDFGHLKSKPFITTSCCQLQLKCF